MALIGALSARRVAVPTGGMLTEVSHMPYAAVALKERETKQKEMEIIQLINKYNWNSVAAEAIGHK